MAPIRAMLLDFGGTLDADGVHWSTLYARAFARAGLDLPREQLDQAFLRSEDEFEAAPGVEDLDLEGHVRWQVRRMLELLLEAGHLSGQGVRELTGVLKGSPVAAAPRPRANGQGPKARGELTHAADRLTRLATAPMRKSLARSCELLRANRDRFAFAIVSNFTPNLHVILEQEGLTPLVDHVFCSSSVGLRKPDPAIFRMALASLQEDPHRVAMVGDSLTADIMPARDLGLTACWIRGDRVFIKGDEDAADHEVDDLAHALKICSEKR